MSTRFRGLVLVFALIIFAAAQAHLASSRADDTDDAVAAPARTQVHGEAALSLIKLVADAGLKAQSDAETTSTYQAVSLKCTDMKKCAIAILEPSTGTQRNIYLGPNASSPLMAALKNAGAKVKGTDIALNDFKIDLDAATPELGQVSFVDVNADPVRTGSFRDAN